MNAAFDSIKAGLTQALAHANGELAAVREHCVGRVAIRQLPSDSEIAREDRDAKDTN